MRYAPPMRAVILALCFFGCGGNDSGANDLASPDLAVPAPDLSIVIPPKNNMDMAMATCPAAEPSGACSLLHVSCDYAGGMRCDCDGHLWNCNPSSCPVSWMVPAFGDACTGTDRCTYIAWECQCASGHYACTAFDGGGHD